MPFRTRDFALFLFAVAFLVVGITATAKHNFSLQGQSAQVAAFDSSSNETVVYDAILPAEREVQRASRLAELREKIAGLVFPEEVAEVEEVVKEEEEIAVEISSGEVDLCPNYTEINPVWSPAGLRFEVVEGARLLYRIKETTEVDELGASSTIPSREVVLQLPLRSVPQAVKSCIASDVVGVALDGSLIRNDEYTLYRVFSEETLVGYALDGFPIYGLSNQKTDECGGLVTSSGYGYVLSAEREGVIGCFSGAAVSI